MYETIILAVCLMRTPSICKEVDISVEPDPTGSLQLPFHCAWRGQMEAQKWIAENPNWLVGYANWSGGSEGQGAGQIAQVQANGTRI